MPKRRYEILLPLRFNDGQPVPPELVRTTKEEILERFDGLTLAPQTLIGVWKRETQVFEDDLIRFVVDVEDTQDNQLFFASLKSVLLDRFQQLEIYIVSFPIERV